MYRLDYLFWTGITGTQKYRERTGLRGAPNQCRSRARVRMDIRPLLAALQSPDPAVRKPAEARVSSLESAPGFLEALHAAGAPGSGLDEGARVLATICCKNIVVRHWRRGQLSDAAKKQLRDGVVRRLQDPSRLVVSQLLQIVQKIARTDYPKAWPSLFNDLVPQLQLLHAPVAAGAQ